ncbi:MAG: hypothetical protein ACI81O_002522 [Cyclobacteriaceae bacterium]|jgi:hypothetical protein
MMRAVIILCLSMPGPRLFALADLSLTKVPL